MKYTTHTQEKDIPVTEPTAGTFSGYWFFFEHAGHRLAVHLSAWSGLETVYVDGEPVSERRNWGLRSDHALVVDGEPLTVRVDIESYLAMRVGVSLLAGGRVLARQSRQHPLGARSRAAMAWQFVGGLAGGVAGYWTVAWLADLLRG